MSHQPRIVAFFARKQLVAVLPYVLLLASLSTTGLTQPRPKSVEDAISEVKHGQASPTSLQRIARARAVEAIPALHEQFVRTEDDLLKVAIASTLVRLGDRERTYWDFLEGRALQAVASDAPFPTSFDAQGKIVPKQLSPEFVEWAKTNKLDPADAATAQMRTVPAQLSFLAATGDARGLAVLRRALASRNYLVEAIAARGLARLQDMDSVPVIITACKRAPAEASMLIARSLVFFNTPQAQSAAETFIHNREALEELRKLSREMGVDALF